MKQRLLVFGVVLLVVFSFVFTNTAPISMASTPLGSTTITINGGGGNNILGTDGQRLVFNASGKVSRYTSRRHLTTTVERTLQL